MPKNLESRNTNKGRSLMQGHDRKASREEGSDNKGDNRQQNREEKFANMGEKWQQSQEEESGNMGENRQQGRVRGFGDVSDYRQQIRDGKMIEANKKNGCLPKLFMLVLPIMAVGTYLILGL